MHTNNQQRVHNFVNQNQVKSIRRSCKQKTNKTISDINKIVNSLKMKNNNCDQTYICK